MRAADLRIGGFAPFSTIDQPGKLVATVFTRGCPWRCGYCHNSHLIAIDGSEETDFTWDQIADHLRRRKGLLDAVVFSGGEPTVQSALWAAMTEVLDMGFSVGMHTNGAYPRRINALLPYLSWVGLDIKAPFDEYDQVTGVEGSGDSARQSLALLADSDIDFEVRTTVDLRSFDAEVLMRLAPHIEQAAPQRWAIQRRRVDGAEVQTAPLTLLDESALRGLLGGFDVEVVLR